MCSEVSTFVLLKAIDAQMVISDDKFKGSAIILGDKISISNNTMTKVIQEIKKYIKNK